MDIAVPGATGMLGRPLVAELVRRGHTVRVLTRTAPAQPQPGSRHVRIDLTTGEGLRDALAGADVVVNAANTPSSGRKASAVLVDGTRRLLDAAAAEGVAHHVEISIVGIDAVPFSYYRCKLAQERVVEAGPVAWTLVRATQFHDLLDRLFATTARAGIVPSMGFPLAPVDARVVARVLADAAEAGPGGRMTPVSGPRPEPLRDLARDWARARGRRVVRLSLPLPRAARRALHDGALVPADGAIAGGPSFSEWLRAGDAPRRGAPAKQAVG